MVDESLIIYGCGGHGRSVADVALANGYRELIFIDHNAKENEKLFGFYIVKDITSIKSNNIPTIIAIGDNLERAKHYATVNNVTSLIAKTASLGVASIINKGVFIAKGVHIGPNAQIGENTIINTHCVIEHDCQIGSHSHISVNATVAGRSKIGNFVMIGAGAVVIDNLVVCSNVIIGAGSVVVKDIKEPGVYVGNPAKKIKSYEIKSLHA